MVSIESCGERAVRGDEVGRRETNVLEGALQVLIHENDRVREGFALQPFSSFVESIRGLHGINEHTDEVHPSSCIGRLDLAQFLVFRLTDRTPGRKKTHAYRFPWSRRPRESLTVESLRLDLRRWEAGEIFGRDGGESSLRG